MKVAYAILVLVALQRVGELWYASRNTRQLNARGGIEYGQRHYPLIVVLHASWLALIAIGIHRDAVVRALPLLVFVLLQALRVCVLATLGDSTGRQRGVGPRSTRRCIRASQVLKVV